ncbi:MAG: primosomal protein N' [Saccharofermentans sp.]|nr:primosomal protein N' [Saccharofermentans sp.]
MICNTAGIVLRDSVRSTDKIYSYLIPDGMEVVPGHYVEVPFGNGNRVQAGLVVSVSDMEIEEKKLKRFKSITRLLDPYPVMNADQIELIKPIVSRYLCTMGTAVSLMVPSALGKPHRDKATFVFCSDMEKAREALAAGTLRSVNQRNVLEYLLENGECERKSLMTTTKSTVSHLKGLKDKGLIDSEIREIDDLEVVEEVTSAEGFSVVHELNEEQQNAVNSITDSITKNEKPEVFLLHGITGSGKTEVYLKTAGNVLEQGGSVIYLVPEISLTPQTVSWITGRFGNTAAVLHSRLTDKQRVKQWNRIRNGSARIIVGPRSCIFAPVKNLKLIILDEEHDGSYKSDSFPKYSAKDIAMLRAKNNNAAIVLGSATPSSSSYFAARNGYYKLLPMTKRANPDAVLPKVRIVNMKEEVRFGGSDILSTPLKEAMARAFADKKQVLLFLNRRGYSRTLVCADCGEPCACPNCSVGMTLHNNRHSNNRLLICHYCGYTIPSFEATCKTCGGVRFTKAGIGTQQLQELLTKIYPSEKILRMDQDTTMTAGSHEEILNRFRNHEASILIGTQMIAKGHDFPDVTVVGILAADLVASSSDYRASERTFQLITQAAGRAGRAGSEGTVFLQCLKPDNPLLQYAARQDYVSFYESEITYRKVMNLPPFKAMGEMVLSLPDEDTLSERSYNLQKYLTEFLSIQDAKYGFELYGPVPAPIYELRGRYRNVFIIKANNKSAMNAIFKQVMKDFDAELYPISFDSDSSGG